MSREKSDSITRLVKIVAKEVFDEEIKRVVVQHNSTTIDAKGFLEKIKSSVEKAGEYWCNEEDSLLIEEVRTALAQIAVNHKRSIGAIKERISTKELLRR